MKLQPDRSDVQTISGYGAGWVGVEAEKITESVLIGSQGQKEMWDCGDFARLTPEHFARLAAFDCELVIFGSGGKIRFPRPEWLRPLMEKRIGLETMDTQAACRTYNILAGEGRRVVAALLIEEAPGTPA